MKKKQTSTSASIIITVTQEQKQWLRKIAATKNLDNPDGNATISSVGRELIEQYLKAKQQCAVTKAEVNDDGQQ